MRSVMAWLRADRPPLRSRFLAPLGLLAGFVDATGGGGWGPVATPTLLVSGRVEPRKVIGSVDTSEFLREHTPRFIIQPEAFSARYRASLGADDGATPGSRPWP